MGPAAIRTDRRPTLSWGRPPGAVADGLWVGAAFGLLSLNPCKAGITVPSC